MGNLGYLVAAYAIIWLAFLGHCYRLGRRQEELRRRLGALREQRRAPAEPPGRKASLHHAQSGS